MRRLTEYWYDAENRRVRKDVGLATTLYYNDGMNEVQESDCLGLNAVQYVYGRGVDELVALDRPLASISAVGELCSAFTPDGVEAFVASVEECSIVNVGVPLEGSCSFVSYYADADGFHVEGTPSLAKVWRHGLGPCPGSSTHV